MKGLEQKATILGQLNRQAASYLKGLQAGAKILTGEGVQGLFVIAGGIVGTLAGFFIAAPAAVVGAAWIGTLTAAGMVGGALAFRGRPGIRDAREDYLIAQRRLNAQQRAADLDFEIRKLEKRRAPPALVANLYRQLETLLLEASSVPEVAGSLRLPPPVRIELLPPPSKPYRPN